MDRSIEAACRSYAWREFKRLCVLADKVCDEVAAGKVPVAEFGRAAAAANEAGKSVGEWYVK